MRRLRSVFAAVSLLVFGCHSPGPYGHSVEYAPLDEEEDAIENAVEYDPVMAVRDPDTWKQRKVSAFGIVEHRGGGAGDQTLLRISIRSLAERNLCDEDGEHTCRVTVSERGHGVLESLVKLSPDDDLGRQRVAQKSLVRVVGTLDYSSGPNQPVLQAQYYRHWPRDEYVTTAARSYMLR
jgi:hypothetical protein